MNEFICPNGRMSVNGICPIFEGDDGQIKDIKKTSTYDAIKEDEIFGEKDVEEKNIFQFDFEEPTESAFKKADNIISNNINAYNSFVEDNLGISSNVQNVFRVGSAISGLANYGLAGAIAPFAIPFMAGAAFNKAENNRIENITNQDTQGDINIIDFQNNNDNTAPSAPAKTSQGVTSAQFAAFRS
tara:strand:+ start:173 stop:730 length:558 start_codon:yes stop_codon:yes gene_type:complete